MYRSLMALISHAHDPLPRLDGLRDRTHLTGEGKGAKLEVMNYLRTAILLAAMLLPA